MCLSGRRPLSRDEQIAQYGFYGEDGYLVIDTSKCGPKRLNDMSAVDCVRFILAIRGVSPSMLRSVADSLELGRDVAEPIKLAFHT